MPVPGFALLNPGYGCGCDGSITPSTAARWKPWRSRAPCRFCGPSCATRSWTDSRGHSAVAADGLAVL